MHSRYIFKSQEHNYGSNFAVCENHTQIAVTARYLTPIKIFFFLDYMNVSIARRVSGFLQGKTPKFQVSDEMKETMCYYVLLLDMVLHR